MSTAAAALFAQAAIGMISVDGGLFGVVLRGFLLVSSGLAAGLLLTNRRVGFDLVGDAGVLASLLALVALRDAHPGAAMASSILQFSLGLLLSGIGFALRWRAYKRTPAAMDRVDEG